MPAACRLPARAAREGYHVRMMCDAALSRRRLLACLAGLAGSSPLAALAQAPVGDEARAGPPPPLGTRIELPELPLLDGRTLRAADLQGQVVVLYWWASWCPFCAVQTPLMDKLWQAERARGLVLLGLSIDRKPDDAAAYLAKRGYAFPSAWVTPAVQRWLPRPKGLPVTVVPSRDRRVVMSEAY